MFQSYVLLLQLFFFFFFLKTSSSFTDNSTVSPLDWEFKEYLTQPDSGIISSLVTTADVGIVVAFQNTAIAGASTLETPGTTWEASIQSNVNGGKLIWSKKTNLLFKTPSSRTQADAAILSWNDGNKEHAAVMFGGFAISDTQRGHALHDTWIYRKTSTSTAWYDQTSTVGNVPPRFGHAMANFGFDNNWIVMFGGNNATSILGDTWLLSSPTLADGGRWSSLKWSTGKIKSIPPPRWNHAMASMGLGLDLSTPKIVMFGGCRDLKCSTLLADTWVLTGKQNSGIKDNMLLNPPIWSKITENSPSKRRSHAMAFLGRRSGNKVLLFGGACGAGLGLTITLCNEQNDGLTWEFDGKYWTKALMYGTSSDLSPRYDMTMAALPDPLATKASEGGLTLVMLGGKDKNSHLFKETWTWGPIFAQPFDPFPKSSWTLHPPAATPDDRAMFAMAQIPGTKDAVLFGGSVAVKDPFSKPGLRDNKPSDDTWTYEAVNMIRLNNQPVEYTWKELLKDTLDDIHPPARQWHQMAGLSNQKVLLFGGATQETTLLNDTWIYNHNDSSWTQRDYLPQGRQYHAMASLSDSKVIMFGGVVDDRDGTSNDQLASNKTMLFDDSKETCCGWREIDIIPGGTFPETRLSHAMAQLNDGTVLLFGGTDQLSGARRFLRDTWLFTLVVQEIGERKVGRANWTRVDTKIAKGAWPPGRMDHAMSSMGPYKVLLYGGCTGDQYHSSCVTFLQDLWMYTAVIDGESPGTWLQVSSVDYGTCGIGPGPRAKHAMAWVESSVVVFGGQIHIIQGSVREATFAGDTWSLPDGCPKGHYMKKDDFGKHSLGCQRCPVGKYSDDHTFSACTSCPVGLTTRESNPHSSDSKEDCSICFGAPKARYYPDHPTWNHGTCYAQCKNDKTGKEICSPKWTCLSQTWGPNCENFCPGIIMLNLTAGERNINELLAPCNNHGNCNNAPDFSAGAGECTCRTPYAGSNCSIDCGQHGDGDPRTNKTTCQCDLHWTGPDCSTFCNTGRADINYTVCVCDLGGGYIGKTCSVPVWLVAAIIILFIFTLIFVLGYKNYQNYQLSIQKEMNRSDAERSLLQGEIALMSEARRIDEKHLEWIPPIIAEGAFGEVWRGVWDMLPNQYVAIKKIKMRGGKVDPVATEMSCKSGDSSPLMYPEHRDSGLEDIDPLFFDISASSSNSNSGNGEDSMDEDGRKELKLLMRLKPHARTVLFHGAGRLRATGEIFLVSEFMDNGDLYSALSKRDKLTNLPTMSWKSRSQIAADIAEGMTFLHSRKPPLIHRDLKSPNVLLRSDGRAKIADFGLSKFTQVQQQKARRVSFETNISNDNGLMSTDMTGAAGTIKWMAPEVQLNANTRDNLTSKYGLAADVYSYGIVLFELVTCRAPWEEFGPFRSKIEIAVQAGKRPKVTDREKQDAGANDANILLDWMVLCWAQDPKDRPSFKQALRACRQIESVSIQYKKDLGGEEIKRSRSTRNTRLSSLLPLNNVEMSINGGSRYKPPIFNDDGDGSSERKELIIRRETEISQLSPSGVGGTDRERSSFDINMISGEIYV